MFLKNCWYVAAWDTELEGSGPIGRVILGEPVAFYRKQDGELVAIADRCPHRHAALSLGRVEGDDLRCMYHGLKFNAEGQCIHVPGQDHVSSNLRVRRYPVVERDNWIWVWMGDPTAADTALIPKAWGLDTPEWTMTAGQLDYEANYQLINDNLTDLSHVDFVHETTLGAGSGRQWSETRPNITPMERALHISRWFINSPAMTPEGNQDIHIAYTYYAPGVFIMRSDGFAAGTAERCNLGPPDGEQPQYSRVEQQAVTPIDAHRTRYLYATGMIAEDARANPEMMNMIFGVIQASFAEDKVMIEAQQKIKSITPPTMLMAPLPQDRGPMQMRALLDRLMAAEQNTRVAAE